MDKTKTVKSKESLKHLRLVARLEARRFEYIHNLMSEPNTPYEEKRVARKYLDDFFEFLANNKWKILDD